MRQSESVWQARMVGFVLHAIIITLQHERMTGLRTKRGFRRLVYPILTR